VDACAEEHLVARPSITSTHNERLKAVRRLRRRRGDAFVAEGRRQLAAALDASVRVREVYAAPALFAGAGEWTLLERAERAGARIVEVGAAAFASIGGPVRPDGLVAVVERWPTGLAQLCDPSLLLVADGIERPGNLGALVRTACAAGAGGLLVSDSRVDVFHEETVRGSVGALFHLPLAQATAVESIAWLRERGIRIVVATPSGRTPHWAADYGRPTALVVGGERLGVSEHWLAAAEETVRIPLVGPTDSLNVAVAAGIVVFEALRPL
jgi:RNA methyltransferase, TrmH family